MVTPNPDVVHPCFNHTSARPLHTSTYHHLAFSTLTQADFSSFLMPYQLLHSYPWSERGQDLIGMAVPKLLT